MDTLVKNHNQYLNISMCVVLLLCFVELSQDKHAKQKANNCQALFASRECELTNLVYLSMLALTD